MIGAPCNGMSIQICDMRLPALTFWGILKYAAAFNAPLFSHFFSLSGIMPLSHSRKKNAKIRVHVRELAKRLREACQRGFSLGLA